MVLSYRVQSWTCPCPEGHIWWKLSSFLWLRSVFWTNGIRQSTSQGPPVRPARSRTTDLARAINNIVTLGDQDSRFFGDLDQSFLRIWSAVSFWILPCPPFPKWSPSVACYGSSVVFLLPWWLWASSRWWWRVLPTITPGWLGDVIESKPDLLALIMTGHCFQAVDRRSGLLVPTSACG